jgi:hypothetical protein
MRDAVHIVNIVQFLVRVLVGDQLTFAVACATNIHTGNNVTPFHKIGVQVVIARAGFNLAIVQVLE